MVVLAKSYPETKNIPEISAQENISPKYLEQLMRELKKNNLVESKKGKSGGYALSKRPSEISTADIIETLEGSITPMKCNSKECQGKVCPSKKVWLKLGLEIKKTLENIKLEELIK